MNSTGFPKQSMHACIVEAHESTRHRLESSLPKDHDDHIAGKGHNSMTHHNFVHKFIPMPQAMKIPDAKAAVDKELEDARNDPSLAVGLSQEQKGVHAATLMDICHLKKMWS